MTGRRTAALFGVLRFGKQQNFKEISKLKKGEKYYVCVRAVKYRKSKSKTYKYYGSRSSKKSFVCK